jgi:hypothetical protein
VCRKWNECVTCCAIGLEVVTVLTAFWGQTRRVAFADMEFVPRVERLCDGLER